MIIGIDPSLTSTGVSNGENHDVIETGVDNQLSQMHSLIARVKYQMSELRKWIGDRDTVYIEDVMKTMAVRGTVDANGNVKGSVGAGHLFEMGVWFAHYYMNFPSPHLVTPSQLKSYVAGKGNFPKSKMPLAVYKRWGIEFEGDPGLDKLHAYCLVQLGREHTAGTFDYTEAKRRGAKVVRSTSKRRKNSDAKETI